VGLATYLADKAKTYFGRQGGGRFVVPRGSECKATNKDVRNLQRNHEEADTKIIRHIHAADSTSEGAMEI